MKVVKSYSLDIRTVNMLERYPHGRKSEVVDDAIRWYIGDDKISYANLVNSRNKLQQSVYELEQSHADFCLNRCNVRPSNGGVKHHLRELLRCLNPFRRQKRE